MEKNSKVHSLNILKSVSNNNTLKQWAVPHSKEFHIIDSPQFINAISQMLPQHKKKSHSIAFKQNLRTLHFKKGHFKERIFYRNMMSEIQRLQTFLSKIPYLHESQLTQYKQVFLLTYLTDFFETLQSQCVEKANLLKRIWNTLIGILNSLVERLVRKMKKDQHQQLKSSISLHECYQQNMEKLSITNKQLEQKNKQIQETSLILLDNLCCKKKEIKNLNNSVNYLSQKIRELKGKINILKQDQVNMMVWGHSGQIERQIAERIVQTKININDILENLPHQYVTDQSIRKTRKSKTAQLAKFKANLFDRCKQQGESFDVDGFLDEIEIIEQQQELDKTIAHQGQHILNAEIFQSILPQPMVDKQCQTNNKQVTNYGQSFNYAKQGIDDFRVHQGCQTKENKKAIDEMFTQTYQGYFQEHKNSMRLLMICRTVKYKIEGTRTLTQDKLSKNKMEKQQPKKQKKINSGQKQQGVDIQKKPQNNTPSSETINFKNKQVSHASYKKSNPNFVKKQLTKVRINKSIKQKVTFHNRPSQKVTSSINSLANLNQTRNSALVSNIFNNPSHKRPKGLSIASSDGSFISVNKQIQSTPNSRNRISNASSILSQANESEHGVKKMRNSTKFYRRSRFDQPIKKSQFKIQMQNKRISIMEIFQRVQRRVGKIIFIDQVIKQIISDVNISTDKQLQIDKGTQLNIYAINSDYRNRIHSNKLNPKKQQISSKHLLRIVSEVMRNAYILVKKNASQLNFVQLIHKDIQRQFGRLNKQEIVQKCISVLESMLSLSDSNHIFKIFSLLCGIEESQHSKMIFSRDVIQYVKTFNLLNCDSKQELNLDTSYTNIEKLQALIQSFKQDKLPNKILQNLSSTVETMQLSEIQPQTKLNIFKISLYPTEEIVKFKIQIYNSYLNLLKKMRVSTGEIITEELVKQIIGFMNITKLQALNMLNRFRASCGISIVTCTNFANFMYKQKESTFQAIIEKCYLFISSIKRFTNEQNSILKETLSRYNEQNKLGTICSLLLCDNFSQQLVSKKLLKAVEYRALQNQSLNLLQKILGKNLVQLYTMSIYCLQIKENN